MIELKRSRCAILPLVLKGKWFDMIERGEKRDVVEALASQARQREDHDRHEAEGDGGIAHERDAAAEPVVKRV